MERLGRWCVLAAAALGVEAASVPHVHGMRLVALCVGMALLAGMLAAAFRALTRRR
jgi:hypothetical protein